MTSSSDMAFSMNHLANFQQKPLVQGLLFVNDETAQEMVVTVMDKYPSMDSVHVEGRRVVEVSVEMFVELMAAQGFVPVAPQKEEK